MSASVAAGVNKVSFLSLLTGMEAGGTIIHVKQPLKSYQCSHVDFIDRVCTHHRENTAAWFHHHFPWDFTPCYSDTGPCSCCHARHRVLAIGQQQSAAHVMRQPTQCHLSDVPVPGEQTAYQLNTKHLTRETESTNNDENEDSKNNIRYFQKVKLIRTCLPFWGI